MNKIATIGAGAIVMLIIAACGSAGTPAATPPPVTPPPPAPNNVVDTSAPPPAPTPTPTPLTLHQQVKAWWNAGGEQDIIALASDFNQNQTDANAYNISAVEADGTQMASDAQTAMADPPPGDPHGYYAAGMLAFERAGNLAAAGDLTDANTEMGIGSTDIGKVTAEWKAENASPTS